MADHCFLCGLSQTQLSSFDSGRDLQLHGPKKNLRLQLDDIRRGLLEVEPELLTDLAEIAAYVFAADNLVSRGGDALKNMGKAWRRRFRLVIAVRQPGIWKEPQRLHALCEALRFLSEDSWDFEFVRLEDPPSIQGYVNFAKTEAETGGSSAIVLFSGGLDSFAGAVHELLAGDRHIVLLSRRIGGMTDGRQSELAEELKRGHPRRVTHVRVSAGLTDETRAVEHTQRTRSFLLVAMALMAAEIERTGRICFYENGIMSVNLPISTQVVGARCSRSTHPRSLMLLQELCRLIRRDDIAIENPFIWKTKVEVVRELLEKPEADAIRHTLSCSRSRQTSYQPHCGTCAQCLQRRIATLGAGAAEADPRESYNVDLLLGPREPGVDRAMAVDTVRSALEFRRLSDDEFATRFAGQFAWLAMSFPGLAHDEVARRIGAMFRRHGEAVRRIFTKAAADHARDLIDHTLPDSCLLQIAVNSPEIDIDEAPITLRPPDAKEERVVASEEGMETGLMLLAVDDAGKRILIDGIAPLTGPVDFRLMSVLVRLHREDREDERAPGNFRTISAADLAEAANTTGEVAGRKAVSRLRKKIDGEYHELYGSRLDADAIIQNVQGKGYRLNPEVRVVAPDQLKLR
jgi:7-cyano-7-deazaguanine synthase in queuosine biosynthesis